MPKIPESTIESIREQTNILDVVSQHVQLKKSGQNWFGLCPFQTEKTPSFSVNEDKQIFKCFSCGKGGNVFNFLMDLNHISFPEAVEEVAKSQNIDIPKQYLQSSSSAHHSQEHQKLIQIYDQVAQLYHHILMNTEIGQPALEYLHQRGLSDETIDTFNLGYAPSGVLLPFLEQRKIDYQEIRHSGLVSEHQDGKLGDRFFNRVMYPIRNANGHTIAFSGRVLSTEDEQAKYLNSPETLIFHKGRTIFNYDLAKPSIKESGNVILFEGFMDVISAFQAGVKNGIASMGTSLTDGQINDIERITKQLYVCYDGDQPGQKAINRALSLLEAHSNLELGVIQMPPGLDPDEYCRQNGNEAFQRIVKNGRETSISFKLSFLKGHLNLKQDEDRLKYIDQSLQVIAKLNSPVERDLYIKKIADQFGLSTASLNSQLSMILSQVDRRQKKQAPRFKVDLPPAEPVRHYDYVEQAERCLLWRMLHDRNTWIRISGLANFHFHDDQYQMIYIFAGEYFKTHDQYQVADFVDFIHNDQYQRWAMSLEDINIPKLSSDDELADYVNIIMYIAPLVDHIKQVDQELKMADRIGDIDRQVQLGSQLIQLKQRLNQQKHMKVKI